MNTYSQHSTADTDTMPLPPLALMRRVGHGALADHHIPNAYRLKGRLIKEHADELLATVGWDRTGKTLLDFGCGSGRTLRWYVGDNRGGQFIGCELDAPSIAWCRNNFPSAFSFHVSSERPPLPLDDHSVDVVIANSVFTHLPGNSFAWLAELHRVLAPEGIVIATWFGEPFWKHNQASTFGPWDEASVGRRIIMRWQEWDHGGPSVAMSEWWLREHWGRAFDILHIADRGFALVDPAGPAPGHGVVVMQRRDTEITPDTLAEPRGQRDIDSLLDTIAILEQDADLAQSRITAERAAKEQALRQLHEIVSLMQTR